MVEIKIPETNLPSPEREPLELGEEYFIFDTSLSNIGFDVAEWLEDETDYKLLKAGLIYRKEEDIQKVVKWFRDTFGSK